ncbi:MAG TPA: MFS transporter [Holophagaceae bacterium]|jgi:DHA1 family solute carrier family 18 vesicular amine transporter 1/2|nr:MFS transporter [Holophagaceae bacterium]
MRLKPSTAALAVTGLAFFTDMLLYYLLVPLLPRYAAELHLSQMRVGILFGSYAVALLAATLPVGRLTDKHGRRSVMLIGLLGLGATTVLFAFTKAYWLLVLARALQGVAGAATWLPGMALLADHFGPEERGRAMGLAFAAANVGALMGPPLSGFLDQRAGPRAPFLVGAALVLLDAAGRAFLLKDGERAPSGPIPWRALLAHPLIRAFTGAMVLASGLWALIESTLPLHLSGKLGLGPAAIGLCFAAAALSHTCASPLLGRLSDRIGRVKVLRIGLALCLVALPLPVFMPGMGTVIAALVLLGATASFVMAPCGPAVADAVESLGRTDYGSGFALLNIAYAVGMVVGPFAGSALVELCGIRLAFVVLVLGYASYGMVLRRWRI